MKILFWVGLFVIVLGIASFFVPVPRSETEGFAVGGLSVDVETRHKETISPFLSAGLIASGLGAMAVARRRTS
jgi:hypothetical protein